MGDCYLINGNLWVYTASTDIGTINGFTNVGSIQGPAGRGIVSTVINNQGQLVITYSDSSVQTVGTVVGTDGITPQLREGSTAVEVSYDNGSTWNSLIPLADITGPQGDPATLPIASSNTLGGVKIGDRISVTNDGTISADYQVLSNTTAGWNAQPTLISSLNTVYVYTDYELDDNNNPLPNIKIGDGLAYLIDMPFVSRDKITPQQIAAWDNKVAVKLDSVDNEILVFYTS